MVAYCEVCGENPAVSECKLCGRRVCENHISNGVCSVCEETLCAICGERLAIGYCISCGRLGCDECLIQVDNVRRICVECAEQGIGSQASRLDIRMLSLKRLGLGEVGEPFKEGES